MTKIYSIIFFVFAVIHFAYGQTKLEKLDELISTYAEYGKFNGSVLVAEKGEIIYKKGFGLANVEWGIPNQPDTKFRLASITKQFTAMLIVQLAAENKIKLDVPISTYLPDYPKKTADIITIHHLLTHTSGIPSYTSFPGYREMMSDPYSPEEIVKLFVDLPLEFTPGERFNYSNSGYILLGYIIEKISGKSYEEQLHSRIFTPLKMNNSGYEHNSAVIKNKASGYDRMGNDFQHATYIDMSVPFSAGGIYSTVEDLFLWDQALYTEKLLPKKYMDLLFNKCITSYGQAYYGYGWEIDETNIGNSTERVPTIGHSGGINGFSTLIIRRPSEESLIVLLSNTSGSSLGEMNVAITGILHDKTYDFPKKSIANSLLDVIEKDGINAALLLYQKIKDSDNYYINEFEMNTAGYQLLQSGSTKEAAFVFKMNVEAFPNAFNTYDSYGEALLALGDTTKSIENYKKSLELNPGNEYGLKALKKLGVNTETLVKKVAIENLKLLEGEYLIANPPAGADKNWKITFKLENGELQGNDKGYKYRLIPVGENKFINPDDGASLVFNTEDKSAITLMLFGKFRFRKVI